MRAIVVVESLEPANLHRGLFDGFVLAGIDAIPVMGPRTSGQSDLIYETKLMELVSTFSPHIIFAIKGARIGPEIIKNLGRYSRTINWQIDDPYEQRSGESLRLASPYQFIFTTDRNSFPNYGMAGGIMQFGFDPFFHTKALGVQQDIQASFVGSLYPTRLKYLKAINEVRCFGANHPRAERNRIPYLTMVEIVNRSKININFADQPDGVLGLKNRIFEILGMGGFLLTEWSYNLDEYFDDGIHLVSFKTVEDLREKIHFYRYKDSLRVKIAEQGYLHAHKCCRYEDRVREMLTLSGGWIK